MYQQIDILVPEREIRNLLMEALCRIPSQCSGSFMNFYPFVPDCLANARPLRTAVLVGLLPSQQIALHADQPLNGVRYHIPLQTNNDCWCFSGGWQHLEVGKVYRMDPSQPHGAVNWGNETRLHLMIDVEQP